MVTNKTTGLQTAGALYQTGKAVLAGVNIITDGVNAATVIVYDNTAGSGTVVYKGVLAGASLSSYDEMGDGGVRCDNGLYVAVSGTGAAYVVHYR